MPEHPVPDTPAAGPRAGHLLHLLPADDWAAAPDGGELRPASLAQQGFVHLSTAEQVALPATRLFRGRDDLLLLVVDPDLLGAEVRWEPGLPSDPEEMRFPHLYGPLPFDAVVATVEYRPDADGTFSAPQDLPV
ncbi:DUF952 domain-containing protein [Rhodococcus aerolatus]